MSTQKAFASLVADNSIYIENMTTFHNDACIGSTYQKHTNNKIVMFIKFKFGI